MVMLESMFSSSLLCLNFQGYHTDFNYEEKKNKKKRDTIVLILIILILVTVTKKH